MKVKQWICLVLALILALGCAGCYNGGAATTEASDTAEPTAATEDTKTTELEETTPPVLQETQAPTSTPATTSNNQSSISTNLDLDALFGNIGASHSHKYSKTTTAPTCTKEGFTTYKCSCGDFYNDNVVSATGHSWGAWSTTKEPTLSAEGEQRRTCSNCDSMETQTIAKLTIPTGNTISLNSQDGEEQTYYEANKAAGLRDGMSELEAVSKINAWLCENFSYELGYVLPLEVLESKKAQCEGYALLFYAMCRNAGIECNIVSGKTLDGRGQFTKGHSWNQVKIGSCWYYIDICWNDVDAGPNNYHLTEVLWADHQVDYVSPYGTIYF